MDMDSRVVKTWRGVERGWEERGKRGWRGWEMPAILSIIKNILRKKK